MKYFCFWFCTVYYPKAVSKTSALSTPTGHIVRVARPTWWSCAYWLFFWLPNWHGSILVSCILELVFSCVSPSCIEFIQSDLMALSCDSGCMVYAMRILWRHWLGFLGLDYIAPVVITLCFMTMIWRGSPLSIVAYVYVPPITWLDFFLLHFFF
jgi:hypothetical protein